MYGLKLKTLAAMDGEDAHTVHVRRFGGDGAIHAIVVQRLDPAHARQQIFARGVAVRRHFTADLEELVDGNQFLLRL